MMAEDFTAYAVIAHIGFDRPLSPQTIQQNVGELMSRIALDCVGEGARLIGHIKCLAETLEGGAIICSVTTEDGRATSSGRVPSSSDLLDVILNVLVYGLSDDRIEEIVERDIPLVFPRATFELEGFHHDHEHEGHDHSFVQFEEGQR